jgi:hypothetical protein
MLKNLLIKLIGKKLDAKLETWGVSKGKIAGWLMFLLPAIEAGSALAGHPVKILTPELKVMLEGFGFWALREGSNSDAVLASAAALNKELEAAVKPGA